MIELKTDPALGLPLHTQVERILRHLITQSPYCDGEKLPCEADLARQLGISRNTVRQGISKLVFEGLLERRAGHGTHVKRKTTETGLGAWSSFSGEMASKGIAVEEFLHNVDRVIPTDVVARALQINPDTTVVMLERVRGYDGMPAVWFRSWFHPRLNLKTNEPIRSPLYKVIEQETGVVASVSQEEITAITAADWSAEHLNVDVGSPLLVRQRVVRDQNGSIMEYAVNIYRTDRFVYSIEISRGDR